MKFIKRNILNETTGLIIHGCNTSGGFGSGIAGQIRVKYPNVFNEFKKNKPNKALLGTVQIVKISDDLFIGNAFTQLNFGNDGAMYADVQSIAQCLNKSLDFCQINNLQLKSPKIGCGLGGLNWDYDVCRIYEQAELQFSEVKINIFYI